MRKILFFILCINVLFFSCTDIDNYDMPNETFGGRFLVEGSESELIKEADFDVKLEELSWSDTPQPFYIPIKPDGSFLNTKLFPGHYRVSTNGDIPFWPIEPIEVDIKGKVFYDFKVVPYMRFKDVMYSVEGNSIKISFKMYPSIKEGTPKILEIQPFVYLANRPNPIKKYSEDLKQIIDKDWSDNMSEDIYEITINDLPKNIFFITIGVRVDKGTATWNKYILNQNEGENGFIEIQ